MKNMNIIFTIFFIIPSFISILNAKTFNFKANVNQKEYENIMFFLAGEIDKSYKMSIIFNQVRKKYIINIIGEKFFLKKLKKNLKRYKTIVKNIPKPKYLNTMNNTLYEKKLKYYIMIENINGIKKTIRRLNNINFSYNSSYTPLYYAISTDNIKIVELLIEEGIHVNYNNSNERMTPLHHASKFGNIEIVRLLLNHGAIVNATDIMGKTPLHYASDKNYKDIIYLLLSKGANKNITDLSGYKPRF